MITTLSPESDTLNLDHVAPGWRMNTACQVDRYVVLSIARYSGEIVRDIVDTTSHAAARERIERLRGDEYTITEVDTVAALMRGCWDMVSIPEHIVAEDLLLQEHDAGLMSEDFTLEAPAYWDDVAIGSDSSTLPYVANMELPRLRRAQPALSARMLAVVAGLFGLLSRMKGGGA